MRIVAFITEVAGELTGSTSQRLEDTLQRLLGQTLSAMGLRASLRKPAVEATPYRVDVLNTDADLAALAAALRHDPRGRLCLYGPPGTGKTAFGRYLAQVLDHPLVLKRASDLLSKWLGETEQRIARMFEEAEHDGALLLLDEADSVLRERARAHVSWEVTQVNEILTQLRPSTASSSAARTSWRISMQPPCAGSTSRSISITCALSRLGPCSGRLWWPMRGGLHP